jgi:hypothetical protein
MITKEEQHVLDVAIANERIADEIVARFNIGEGPIVDTVAIELLAVIKPTEKTSKEIREYLIVALANEEYGNEIADQLDAIVEVLEVTVDATSPDFGPKLRVAQNKLKPLSAGAKKALEIACANEAISKSIAQNIYVGQNAAYTIINIVWGTPYFTTALGGPVSITNDTADYDDYHMMFDVPENADTLSFFKMVYSWVTTSDIPNNVYFDVWIYATTGTPGIDEKPDFNNFSYVGYFYTGTLQKSNSYVLSPEPTFWSTGFKTFKEIGAGQYGSDEYFATGTVDVRGKRASIAIAAPWTSSNWNNDEFRIASIDFSTTDNPQNLAQSFVKWNKTTFAVTSSTEDYQAAPMYDMIIGTSELDEE